MLILVEILLQGILVLGKNTSLTKIFSKKTNSLTLKNNIPMIATVQYLVNFAVDIVEKLSYFL